MNQFKKYNLIAGWATFAFAAVVYLMTIEPTASLWDCSEFIATSYKLEVGHPPGAPLFMMISRLFAIFAPSPAHVAMMINSMSALASAATILFLFWSITHLARRSYHKSEEELTLPQITAIMGAGLVGSIAYTFTDTFWFSAVEGEVYALSSMFTALVFWAILKWENVADEPHAEPLADPDRLPHGARDRRTPAQPADHPCDRLYLLFQEISANHQMGNRESAGRIGSHSDRSAVHHYPRHH